MIGSGRILGAILLVAGLALCAVVALFLGAGVAGQEANVPAAILGIGLFGVIPLLVLGGAGVFLLIRGQAESRELGEIRQKQRLLGMIQAQGQVSLGNAMIELHMTRDQIQTAIYDLVNQGLFAGFIDWSAQTFYSRDAAQVGSTKCPNCGGVREIAGKGIVKCPYCGVQLFIPQVNDA